MERLLVWISILICSASLASAEEQIRFRLDIDAFGNCTVVVGVAKDELVNASEQTIEPYKSRRLPKSRIDRNNGFVRLIHTFADADPLESISSNALRPPTGVAIDKRFGVLAMTSRKGQEAALAYAYRVKPPLAIAYDRHPFEDGTSLRTQVMFGGGVETLIVNLKSQDRTAGDKLLVGANWRDTKTNLTTQIVEPIEFTIQAGIKKQFRLPVPNAEIASSCILGFTAISEGRSIQEITSLLIQGKLSPMIGVGFDERAGLVYAKTISQGGLAEQSGVKTGDVVLSINGHEPKDTQHAVSLIAEAEFGENLTLELSRGKQNVTLTMPLE